MGHAKTSLPGLSTPALSAIREQILSAAEAFSSEAQPLKTLLAEMVRDVDRASSERLEIFPVCHHSPSSGVHLLQRLRSKAPRVLFVEMCEDLHAPLAGLKDCKFPIALQAFALEGDRFPKSWSPLSVVTPLTEFSAEYQAIAFAEHHPETALVFVDRSVDHVFQWMPQEENALAERTGKEEEPDADPSEGEKRDASHGSAVGVQAGLLEPTFGSFLEFLTKNARVRHFAEWWEQYVEQALLGANYDTYRHVMFLLGSLLRRLGRKDDDRREDRLRERFMWTRMKQYLAKHQLKPEDALYICGAAHSASDVEEFGCETGLWAELPAPSGTKWSYGLIPSSFAAIERQFHHPPGTLSLAEGSWEKAVKALSLVPFSLKAAPKAAAPAKAAKASKKGKAATPAPEEVLEAAEEALEEAPAPVLAPAAPGLLRFLQQAPTLAAHDEEQLLRWSVEIVNMARRNGYLASTADAISTYQTALLLANLRNRRHPTPYDFQDAAITCLEKDRTPKKRNVQRMCEILLGGDRVGLVGENALPPLAKDVYDRLRPLGVKLDSPRLERALLDFKKRPELLPCSDLLWSLYFLIGGGAVRPIMGERSLGQTPIQESWDLGLGKYQRSLVELAYEGVNVEHVLERRLKKNAFAPDARTVKALESAEQCILYLKSARLTEELGQHAVHLLTQEGGAKDAPEVFERVRRLVHFYRSTPGGIPPWLREFVTTGYSHYSTLLPKVFADQGTKPDEVAAMLAFLFTLESLALSFGCQRSQLLIAVSQAGPGTEDPTKLGLLWAAEWLLGLRKPEHIREFLDRVLENEMLLPAFPAYVSGFLLALRFTPLVTRLVVELLSKAFARLPDSVLMPWMPGLLLSLRQNAQEALPALFKEADGCFPRKLGELASWVPSWEIALPEEEAELLPAEEGAEPRSVPAVALSAEEEAVRAMLFAQRAPVDAFAALLGLSDPWREASPAPSQGSEASSGETASPAASPKKAKGQPQNADEAALAALLSTHPATTEALAALLS